MNEIGRDITNPGALSAGLLRLLLKLWFIVMVGFMGLWVLGVILMFWHILLPVGIAAVWWASSSSSTTTGDSST